MSEPTGMPRYPNAGGPPPPPGPAARAPAPGAPNVTDEPTGSIEAPPSRFQTWIRNAGWVFLAVFCFVFFTVSKLPRDRINEFVQATVSSALSSRGISFTAKKSELSLLFGISYEMEGVTLNFPPPEKPAHIDEIVVSPSILPLLLGKYSGTVAIHNAGGDLKVTGGLHGSRVEASFSARNFDLGSIALLRLMANLGGSAVVSGQGTVSADSSSLTETDADITLDLSKIVIDAQSIQGFAIPKLTMSEGKIDLSIDHGKGMLRTLQIGRPGSPTDDIRADISGDILLGKKLETSTCNLKATFSFSPDLMKSFSLIGALLAPGRQPDGSFSYKLSGPLLSPNPVPAGAR